jgi:hypothetical protein
MAETIEPGGTFSPAAGSPIGCQGSQAPALPAPVFPLVMISPSLPTTKTSRRSGARAAAETTDLARTVWPGGGVAYRLPTLPCAAVGLSAGIDAAVVTDHENVDPVWIARDRPNDRPLRNLLLGSADAEPVVPDQRSKINPMCNRWHAVTVEDKQHVISLGSQRARMTPIGCCKNESTGLGMVVQEPHFDDSLLGVGLVGHGPIGLTKTAFTMLSASRVSMLNVCPC